MAPRRLFASAGWLVALVAFGGCGDGSNHPTDMNTGGDDLAGDGGSGPTVGGTVTGLAGSGLILQNNGGDDLTLGASGAFVFPTPLADGAAYDVSILTQPTSPPQICSVANGKGTIAGGASVSSVAVRCAPVVRFVLVADKSDNSVGSFALDAASGRLRYAGKSAAGMQPVSIATDAAGQWAYVANAGDGTVSQYAVDGNGRLGALSPATVTVGAGLAAVALDPAGTHAYAVATGGVAQFAVGSDGKLTALSPATVSAGATPAAIVVEPSGRFAYVANGDGSVSQFSVGADGALTALPPATVAAGMGPSGIAVDPTGRFVYVTNAAGKSVSPYSIGSDGTLTPGADSVLAGTGATSPIVDPSGKYAWVANPGDKTVSQYSIGSDGALTPAATATTAAGTGAAAVLVDGTGHYAWVANPGDDTVAEYVVGSGGTLAPNAPATLRGQGAPAALAVVGGSGPALPTATHAYVTDRTGSVRDFAIGATGALGTPSSIAVTGHPQGIVFDAAGTHAYVLDNPFVQTDPGNILQYAVSATGAWTALTPASVAAGPSPQAIALHPAGRFAYVVNNVNTSDTISQFAVAADGTMTALTPPTVATLTQPIAVAIDPSGRFAYAATATTIVVYSIGTDGTLTMTSSATVPVGAAPSGIALDPSGRFAYVSNGASSGVLQFAINGSDGSLAALTPASAASGSAPQSVALDPFGRFGYVVNANACTVSQYLVGSAGPLAALSPASVAAGDCVTAMDGVSVVAVDPSGRFVYVPAVETSSSAILQYAIGAGGVLSPLSPAATGALSAAQLERIEFVVRYQ